MRSATPAGATSTPRNSRALAARRSAAATALGLPPSWRLGGSRPVAAKPSASRARIASRVCGRPCCTSCASSSSATCSSVTRVSSGLGGGASGAAGCSAVRSTIAMAEKASGKATSWPSAWAANRPMASAISRLACSTFATVMPPSASVRRAMAVVNGVTLTECETSAVGMTAARTIRKGTASAKAKSPPSLLQPAKRSQT